MPQQRLLRAKPGNYSDSTVCIILWAEWGINYSVNMYLDISLNIVGMLQELHIAASKDKISSQFSFQYFEEIFF